jgi:hypothetical protein
MLHIQLYKTTQVEATEEGDYDRRTHFSNCFEGSRWRCREARTLGSYRADDDDDDMAVYLI